MNRGEVRWYRFGPPDKKRPVVILTRTGILDHMGEVTVAPITTRIRNIPTEVVLTRKDGMPSDCAINLDHLQTIQKGKVGALITSLNKETMERLRDPLLFALGFSA